MMVSESRMDVYIEESALSMWDLVGADGQVYFFRDLSLKLHT